MSSTNSFPLWSLQSIRLRITILLAVALCIEGLMRTNMNMAMICMVNLTAIMQFEQSLIAQKPDESLINYNYTTLPNSCARIFERKRSYNGDLVWTSQEQAWIFAAFYVGSLFVILPGSYLCDWIGPAHTVQGGAIINIIGSIITPYISRKIGVIGVIIIRFYGLWSRCINTVYECTYCPLVSIIRKSTAVALATTGLLGIGLCFGWFLVVKDVPTRMKHITDAELIYITGSAHGRGQKRVIPLNVPWREILSSTAVWSTALSSFSQSFVIVGTVTYLPLYYRTILSMDLTSNGVLSALPFICQLITKLAFASLADKAKESGITWWGMLLCCINIFDCNHRNKAVTLICLAMGILSGFVPGYNTSIVCIAPKYTASVASFCRLWEHSSVISEWRTVFIIMICILTSTGAIFQLFGTVNEQKWAQDVSGISILNDMNSLEEKEVELKLELEKGMHNELEVARKMRILKMKVYRSGYRKLSMMKWE
ncbi:hypothetical protein DINM_020866 [Dirofilaria immitis]|nr:hypothetical protein [Dirofilaria immitis]